MTFKNHSSCRILKIKGQILILFPIFHVFSLSKCFFFIQGPSKTYTLILHCTKGQSLTGPAMLHLLNLGRDVFGHFRPLDQGSISHCRIVSCQALGLLLCRQRSPSVEFIEGKIRKADSADKFCKIINNACNAFFFSN